MDHCLGRLTLCPFSLGNLLPALVQNIQTPSPDRVAHRTSRARLTAAHHCVDQDPAIVVLRAKVMVSCSLAKRHHEETKQKARPITLNPSHQSNPFYPVQPIHPNQSA